MKNIYVIKNKINNKLYVGATKMNVAQRFHRHAANKGSFGDEIRRFEIESFSVTLLESCSFWEERETFYIEKFNSIFPNGYNKKRGGNKGSYYNKKNNNNNAAARSRMKKVVDQNGKVYESLRAFCSEKKINPNNFWAYKTDGGYVWHDIQLRVL